MPTDNIVLDGTWEQIQNTAQGGYHHIASNPYLMISVLAIGGLIAFVLIVLAIVFITKAFQAQRIELPATPEPTYKYTEKTVTTVVTKPKKKKTTKKKSKKSK